MKTMLRRFRKEDIHAKVDWINNPIINKNMFFDLPATIEKTAKWYKTNMGNNQRIDFTLIDPHKKEVLAFGGFTGISAIHKNAEFYIMVHPEKQGRGIGKKASVLMINYAFSILNLHKIYLYTNNDNIAAYRLYEKIGFTLEGVMKEHKFKNGKFQNRRFYGLLKSQWAQLEWQKKINDEI